MHVTSLCPLRVASFPWRPSSGGWALTVLCKATFELHPGELRLAEHQEVPNEEDNFWDDDPRRSLYSPSDLVPVKTRADVMLVGQAFAAPPGTARSVIARLAVCGVNKAIEVCTERVYGADGGVREAPGFSSMPLRYERAASSAENPVGMREGGRTLPNLQPPGTAVGRAGEAIPSVGFGPIAPGWPGRLGKLGRHGARFADRSWEAEPLPDDFDASFFNAAPEDQQPDRLEPGARLVLENLSPRTARLVTKLPTLRPRAFADTRTGALQEVALTCDTLWIDSDRGVCTLTWRGQLAVSGPDDPGRVFVLLEHPETPLTPKEINDRWAEAPPPDEELPPSIEETVAFEGTRQFDLRAVSAAYRADALPFTRSRTEVVPVRGEAPAGWLEARAPAPPPASPPAQPPPQRPSQVDLPPPSMGPDARRVDFDHEGPSAAPAPRPVAPQPAPSSTVGALAASRAAGVLGASNAAAAAAAAVATAMAGPAPAETPRAPVPALRDAGRGPGEILDLLWFDPTAPDRARLNLPWQELIARIQPVLPEVPHDDDPPEDPQPVKDRRDVFGVLAEGEPTPEGGLEALLLAASSPKGAFTPPIALVAGELEMVFDETETLKATLTAVAPLAGGDKKLKDAFELVTEALKSPWIQGSTRAAEGFTSRLREAFPQGVRAMPPGYLEGQVERALVEARRYQRRTVLGQTWLRSLLTAQGGASQSAPPVPVYLPEELAGKLPLVARFQVRLLVEAHVQQDPLDGHPCTLRALALARAIKAPRRG